MTETVTFADGSTQEVETGADTVVAPAVPGAEAANAPANNTEAVEVTEEISQPAPVEETAA